MSTSQEVTATTPSTVASTSSSPLHSHRFPPTNAPVGGGSGQVLHVNTTPGESILHSGTSSAVSPSALGVGAGTGAAPGGPPLKLRFAMEAGHYTLMENQENASATAGALDGADGNLLGPASGGAPGSVEVFSGEIAGAPTIIDVTPGVNPEEDTILPKLEEETGQSASMLTEGALKPEPGTDQVSVFYYYVINLTILVSNKIIPHVLCSLSGFQIFLPEALG